MANFLQQLIITFVRPITTRELPGWGKIYQALVGSYENNNFWQGAGQHSIKGKRHEYLMELDLAGWSERSAFFLGRWYDLPTQLLIDETLKSGDTVIDIGGNIGMFSLAARAKIGAAGRIFAFEPNPVPRNKFIRHLEINHLTNIEIMPYALHDKEGNACLNFPKINTGEGSMSELTYAPDATITIDVEVKVGDQVLNGVNPRLIKIDVEGAEIGVLAGLTELIDRAKPVITAENNLDHLKRFDVSFIDFQIFAENRNYKIFRLGLAKHGWAHQLSLIPIRENAPSGGDIVLIHNNDTTLDHVIVE